MVDLEKVNLKTKVKIWTNQTPGVPSILNEWGSLVKVLKHALVDGTDSIPVESYEVRGELLEITLPEYQQGIPYNTVIKITGSDQPEINSEYRVVVSASKTVFVSLKDKTKSITGTLTLSIPPLGWELAYNGIEEKGTACFKSKASTPKILKVIDALPPNGYDTNWVKFARLTYGLKTNSNGVLEAGMKTPKLYGGLHNQYPNPEDTGNNSDIYGFCAWIYTGYNSNYWYTSSSNFELKNTNINNNQRSWVLIGTDEGFYLFNSLSNELDCRHLYYFGEYNRIGDSKYNCLLVSSNIYMQNSINQSFGNLGTGFSYNINTYNTSSKYGFNSLTDVYGNSNSNYILPAGYYLPYHNKKSYSQLNGELITRPYYIQDGYTNSLIGSFKGLQVPFGNDGVISKYFSDGGGYYCIYFQNAYENSESFSYAFIDLKDFE